MNLEQNDDRSWEELISAVRRNDPAATQVFAGRLGSLLRRFFCSLGLRSDSVEDIAVTCVTEITLKLLSKSDGFHGGSFVSWAFTVARHILADEHRRQPELVSIAPEVWASIADSTASALENTTPSDPEIALLRALSLLNATDRHLLVARSGREPAPFNQLARELGISEGNARARNARALVKLKKLLMADERIRKWLGRRRRPLGP